MDISDAEFWKLHSDIFLEMAFRSDRRERFSHPDGYGKKTGDCGDTIEFFLKLSREEIQRVAFDTDGCLYTVVCCNAVGSLAEAGSLDAAWRITPQTVNDYLETLPEDHLHCAELAVGTLYLALADCRQIKKHSWKKLYR